MNDARAKWRPLGRQSICAGQKPVDERGVSVTGAGMDDNPMSLVDDDQMFVFEEDIQRHRARIERFPLRFGWKPDGYAFSRTQLVADLEGLPRDLNPAFQDPFLDLAPGSIRESPTHEYIEPATRLRWFNVQDNIRLIPLTTHGVRIQCCCLWWSESRIMVKINRPAVV
jgi:hypothetical protein